MNVAGASYVLFVSITLITLGCDNPLRFGPPDPNFVPGIFLDPNPIIREYSWRVPHSWPPSDTGGGTVWLYNNTDDSILTRQTRFSVGSHFWRRSTTVSTDTPRFAGHIDGVIPHSVRYEYDYSWTFPGPAVYRDTFQVLDTMGEVMLSAPLEYTIK